ncbi:hypothetical protein CONLIGDRAFT_682454 [Coniochaeta ligniaria NRRL 30616]|uniref:RING-CH-type domain-containing protein n=1 Tax=Coniochaeta ligniaria NRRL 30616 TaxID=1408157 RepID=A0A1J7IJ51_9PEZI|nr:hypothetical protein CONLIGDRAFT_682454 [Coniochaeta ligniaria NRRL 30616]
MDVDGETPTASAGSSAPYESPDYQPSASSGPSSDSHHHSHQDEPRPAPRQKHYKPRTCRICLEVVQPVTEIQGSATGFFAPQARVRYISEDAELGRLISPCKCKGSQKYVHEGCLRAWRQAQPFEDRNYWSCPTCKFKYRLQRLWMGKWLTSWLARAVLTVTIMAVAVFVLGFVADPIINLWIDPVGTVADSIADVIHDVEGLAPTYDDEPFTWAGHFMKGVLSLGLLGFLKTFLGMGPFYWFRWGTNFGGGRRNTGRDRAQQINWAFIVIGIITFMGATWKLVNLFSARLLESANELVLDIQQDGDDDDDDEDEEPVPGTVEESRKDM